MRGLDRGGRGLTLRLSDGDFNPVQVLWISPKFKAKAAARLDGGNRLRFCLVDLGSFAHKFAVFESGLDLDPTAINRFGSHVHLPADWNKSDPVRGLNRQCTAYEQRTCFARLDDQ